MPPILEFTRIWNRVFKWDTDKLLSSASFACTISLWNAIKTFLSCRNLSCRWKLRSVHVRWHLLIFRIIKSSSKLHYLSPRTNPESQIQSDVIFGVELNEEWLGTVVIWLSSDHNRSTDRAPVMNFFTERHGLKNGADQLVLTFKSKFSMKILSFAILKMLQLVQTNVFPQYFN